MVSLISSNHNERLNIFSAVVSILICQKFYDTVYLYSLMFFFLTEEADRILDDETGLLALPHGVPSLESIEKARLNQKNSERLLGNDIWM